MDLSAAWQTPIGKLRLVGMLEGTSFILLLFVAMPLKYWMGMPAAVSVVGMLHGILFLWLCYLLVDTVFNQGWRLKPAALVFLAALFPFGPFVIDRWLKRQQTAA